MKGARTTVARAAVARAAVTRTALKCGILCLFWMAGCATTTAELPPSSTEGPAPGWEEDKLARAIHTKINEVRAEYGLGKLQWDDQLARIARGHSADMADRNYFEHDTPEGRTFADRYARAGYACQVPLLARSYLVGAENLAMVHRMKGWRTWPDGRREPYGWRTIEQMADEAVRGWLNSPPHRENLLRPPWRREGIGIAPGPDGKVLITQNFC